MGIVSSEIYARHTHKAVHVKLGRLGDALLPRDSKSNSLFYICFKHFLFKEIYIDIQYIHIHTYMHINVIIVQHGIANVMDKCADWKIPIHSQGKLVANTPRFSHELC